MNSNLQHLGSRQTVRGVPDPDVIECIAKCLNGRGRRSSDYDLNAGAREQTPRVLSPAAVLIGLLHGKAGIDVIMTKRASGLKHHPGQIAFPGGRVEPDDGSAVEAAVREAREEIGLDPKLVKVLGKMPDHETVTGFVVTPVIGWICGDFVPAAERGEVDEVFRVPLAHVTDKSSFRIERRQWRGVWRRYYTVPYGPHYIWGATGRMLWALADGMDEARGG
jgi:8-oxo-dGTP pyrophosphatase MutT (NUDIX family)